MPKFERIGGAFLNHEGTTNRGRITLTNGAVIEIKGGQNRNHFRLKFANEVGDGWWVTPPALEELIAELLFILEELSEFDAELRPVGMMFGDEEVPLPPGDAPF